MNRQITQEETEQLFQFCRRHYVYHYDVQIELVDHLATAIEGQWEQNTKLSFDEGLKNSFKKFGIYGFSKIKSQKEKELRRKYNRLLWHFMLDFYRWPKVITTFVCTLGLFLLFQLIEQSRWIILGYLVLLTVGTMFYYFGIHIKTRLKIKPGKSFLLADQYNRASQAFVLVINLPNFCFHTFNLLDSHSIQNTWLLLGLSFFMVAFSVLLYGQLFYLPKKIKEHFIEQFAEFAL
ncbi:hypothetical protein [uncultured Draconibacterium sp.]|uniref:hypothetical protein n=1 Tax=uncultured Draconibacterium sp. TaxID=1573823 RepID=UPI0029C91671|nr:hypothetical protein [uncultured Draconibacterium sp.]